MKNPIKIIVLIVAALTLTSSIAFRGTSIATVPNESEIISLNSSGNGQGGNGKSTEGIPSADGNFIAFDSEATNLVSNDTNGVKDVYVRNLKNNSTERVSISTAGIEANGYNTLHAISQNGRYIVFASRASNLIDGETNSVSSNLYDVYLRDTKTNQTTMLNKNSSGVRQYRVQVTGISGDGRFIVADTNSYQLAPNTNFHGRKLIVLDRVSNTWKYIDEIPGDTQAVSNDTARMSCDGAFIVYQSAGGRISLVDRRDGQAITNITLNSNGYESSPRISCDGRYIGFQTSSTNLVSGVTPTDGVNHLIEYDSFLGTYEYLDVEASGSFISRNTTYNTLSSFSLDNKGRAAFALQATYPYSGKAYIRNISNNTTEVISLQATGGPAFSFSAGPVYLDAEGKSVVYQAKDSDAIVSVDSNGFADVIRSKTGW